MRLLLSLSILFMAASMSAQATFSAEPQVSQLMEMYTSQGKSEESVDGWRIKLISTTDRRAWEATRGRFSNMYPDRTFTSSYENPYYSLKTGAFVSRFDLEPFLMEYKDDFPQAIIFRDKILKTDLFQE